MGKAIRPLDLGRETEGDFIPDLCNVQAVFSLILVGELLAFAFVLVDHGLVTFQWLHFGAVSFLTQWIILVSAACLCPLRPWFRAKNGLVAGSVSYTIVLTVTVVFTYLGLWVSEDSPMENHHILLENLVIAAILAGVVLRYFYLQQQLHNREQAELRSRIQALQSRIRPHFLFNSMNSIASLIDIDPKAAEDMVVNLSQLFRASLSETALVPIEDEIRLCKQFISIEQTRLGKRLKVNWELNIPAERAGDDDATATPYLIPSLMIQPLLENSIYHGIQPLANGGTVSVRVDALQNEIRIHVHNPVAEDRNSGIAQSNGIALENIRHRLNAHFGEKASMKCVEGNSDFKVDIRYPISTKVKVG